MLILAVIQVRQILKAVDGNGYLKRVAEERWSLTCEVASF